MDGAVVATPGDAQTLLATQLLRNRFDGDSIVALSDDPELTDVLGDRADAVVGVQQVLAPELVAAYERVAVPTIRR